MRPLRRLAAALASWGLLFAASPGVLTRDGVAALALVALVPWALAARRPGPRAFAVEWLAAAVGFSALTWWSTFVWWGTLLAVAIVPAAYVAAAGAVLRRLARPGVPLALAVPAAWVALEALRSLVEPPFGFGWLRLGHHLHAFEPLSGAARVFGVGGLSWAVAAASGGVADLVLRFRAPRETAPGAAANGGGQAGARHVALVGGPGGTPWPVVAALAMGPLALSAALGLATSAPQTVPGPRVLLVQPSFEQRRKMERASASELFAESLAITGQGLAQARAAGEPAPDLVAWGETMFPYGLPGEGLRAAWERGARPVAWARDALEDRHLGWMEQVEREWVGGALFGHGQGAGAVLPEGASFLSGVELYVEGAQGAIRRRNGVVLWDARGERAGAGGKVHLVPGAETLVGLERFGWVRDLAAEVAGYVPDLEAWPEVAVLPLAGRDGRRWSFGVTVCFDNAYLDPYTAPLRRGPLDFHLVCSNEAWYEESFEYDQMIAFSRIAAIASGRSIVRATNAGISAVIAPDGREVARLAVGGRDRMVSGTLRATVPVPAPEERGRRTPFVAGEHVWTGAWLVMPALVALAGRRGYRRAAPG